MSNQLRKALIVVFGELQIALADYGDNQTEVEKAIQVVIQLLHVEGMTKLKTKKGVTK